MGIGVGLKTAAAAVQKRTSTSEHEVVEDPHGHALAHLAPPTGNGASGSRAHSPHTAMYGSTSNTLPLEGSEHRRLRSSPEHLRRESSLQLDCVPEDTTMQFDFEEGQRYSTTTSPVGGDDDDDDETDEETAEEELDEELEEQGLYRGSYHRLLALYTLVPLTAIVTFILVAAIPSILYPSRRSTYPYAPFLPFPIPELLVSIALWCFAFITRGPLFSIITSLASYFPSIPAAAPILSSTGIHTLASLVLQQAALPLLLVPHYALSNRPTASNPAFKRVWWIALGWAAAEAVAAVKQGYENIALYRGVLVTVYRNEDDSEASPDKSSVRVSRSPLHGEAFTPPKASAAALSPLDLLRTGSETPSRVFDECDERRPLLVARSFDSGDDDEFKMQVDQDIDEILALKAREELEEAYGVPFIRIPVFISCLQRINSILMSLGVCLLLSHAYMCSTVAVPLIPTAYLEGGTNTPLLITVPVVAAIQSALAFLHTPLVLPVLGVPTVVYAGSLISLGTFFAGLGVWEGLV